MTLCVLRMITMGGLSGSACSFCAQLALVTCCADDDRNRSDHLQPLVVRDER